VQESSALILRSAHPTSGKPNFGAMLLRMRAVVLYALLAEVNRNALNLSLNLATVRMQWKLPQAVEAAARHGFTGVAPWREMVQETGIAESARVFKANGMRVTGYCRGGLFGPAAARTSRRRSTTTSG